MSAIKRLLAGLGLCSVIIATFYTAMIHYQEQYEVAIMWNKISGHFWLEERGGFHRSAPWVLAAKIDLRPNRVAVTSASRSYNSKLVQFDPKFYREFVALEGTRYYWWSNRISFNLGYSEEYRGMKDILRGYTYAMKHYPFIKVVKEFDDLN
ncbi:hypothetical protein HGA34_01510 [Candidatus Falkowbacteria bacterium]|nr:hypothetical protein [Candidatus Falkowbacteria bacterium]